ncbi:hypothetical protein M3P05_02625 [Sansalvadorimonas sp. 2012CJ34-2]|uniref:Uncharacterized protein n=1 Tax=Parendozoicomonas callyspongiae TaxID=2942213 RepID=A0ABT0PBT2_9GAMM|nr:hypothetical protein [Sansalvadorimonas sp. 2012CJ34-2]MCL6268845.1 hypothetical protein [Sansalvadorimonas sp. 2012CJ34-2]
MSGLKATSAGRNRQMFIIDGSVIQAGLGPRIGEVALKLAKQMYIMEPTAKP